MTDNTILNNLNNKLSAKIAEIRSTYNTDPRRNQLAAEIAEIKTQIEAIKVWSKVS